MVTMNNGGIFRLNKGSNGKYVKTLNTKSVNGVLLPNTVKRKQKTIIPKLILINKVTLM